MNRPDVTRAQITVIVGQVAAVAVAFGVNISPDQQKELLALAFAFGSVLVWADKEIRKHRAAIEAARVAAQKPPLTFTGTTATTGGVSWSQPAGVTITDCHTVPPVATVAPVTIAVTPRTLKPKAAKPKKPPPK